VKDLRWSAWTIDRRCDRRGMGERSIETLIYSQVLTPCSAFLMSREDLPTAPPKIPFADEFRGKGNGDVDACMGRLG
jgi:hypothetical protein